MNYIFRIAVGIFTLSVCLNIYPVTTVPVKPMMGNINRLRANTSCPGNLSFYTPTNVKEECITDGLECFKQQLDKVAKECNSTTDHYIKHVKNSLDKMIKERSPKVHGPTDSTDCACKSSPKLPFSDFLDKMKSLAQHHATTQTITG